MALNCTEDKPEKLGFKIYGKRDPSKNMYSVTLRRKNEVIKVYADSMKIHEHNGSIGFYNKESKDYKYAGVLICCFHKGEWRDAGLVVNKDKEK